MQLSYFTDGGYVVHKAAVSGAGRYSAWFDNNGIIKDAEQIDLLNRSRHVKQDSRAWKHLQAVYGRRENFKDWHAPHCNK